MLASDFYKAMDDIAPFASAESWDNSGLIVGGMDAEISGALLALDVAGGVIDEAVSLGYNLIITHHPVIFDPVRRLAPDMNVWRLVREGIAVICAHTNLDMAKGGVNDALADALGLKNRRPLTEISNPPYTDNARLTLGIVGELENPLSPHDFAEFVKTRLGLSGLRYSSGEREIAVAAVCGGSGADYLLDAVKAGADAYVTGESKYFTLLEARRMGVTHIEAGHCETERIVLEPLSARLKELLPGEKIEISRDKSIFYA